MKTPGRLRGRHGAGLPSRRVRMSASSAMESWASRSDPATCSRCAGSRGRLSGPATRRSGTATRTVGGGCGQQPHPCSHARDTSARASPPPRNATSPSSGPIPGLSTSVSTASSSGAPSSPVPPPPRAMSALASRLPDSWWNSKLVLGLMGRVAGPLLGAEEVRLHGRVPSEQWFTVNPLRVWATRKVQASLRGESLGGARTGAPAASTGRLPGPQSRPVRDRTRHVRGLPVRPARAEDSRPAGLITAVSVNSRERAGGRSSRCRRILFDARADRRLRDAPITRCPGATRSTSRRCWTRTARPPREPARRPEERGHASLSSRHAPPRPGRRDRLWHQLDPPARHRHH